MTRIGFLEMSTHEQVLYYLIRAANGPENSVTIFTTEDIARKVTSLLDPGEDDFEWVLQAGSQSFGSFLDEIESRTESLDLLVIQPLYLTTWQLYQFTRFSPTCHSALWLFNLNTWLQAGVSLRSGIRGNFKSVFRRMIANRYPDVLVEYPSMAEYVRAEFDVESVVSIMPTLYESPEPSGEYSISDSILVTIPGNISPDRRDYELALDAYEQVAEPEGLLKLRLQGQCVGAKSDPIIDRCRSLKESGYPISWDTEWLPITEFHASLRRSDLLLSPLKVSNAANSTAEVYGKSKGSGNISDAVRNSVPLLLPEGFPVDSILGDGVRYFSSEASLGVLLKELRDDDQALAEFKEAALHAARQYTLPQQQTRFNEVIDALLTS